MKGPCLLLVEGITAILLIQNNFQPCSNKHLDKPMFNLDLAYQTGIPNRDMISTEYSKKFHDGLPVSYNNVAIYSNITHVLRTAPATGRSFIIPQDRVIFIRIENEPHFHQVMTSIDAYSQHVSKWKLTYILGLPGQVFTPQKIAQLLSPHAKIYVKVDIASRVFLEFTTPYQEIFEIYFIKESLVLKPLKTFSLTPFGLILGESDLSRRKNFAAVMVNGVTQDDKDLDLIATFENSTIPKFCGGLSVTYFELMATGLNFSIGAVRGTGWIHLGQDGNLLGMAQQLLSGDADILIAHSELLPYRLRGLKFLHPYYRGSVRAFFKQPGLSKIRNIFFQPLQPSVWACLGLLWLLLVGSLRGAFILKRKLLGGRGNDSKRGKFGRKSSDISLVEENMDHDEEEGGNMERNLQMMDKILARDAFLWAISTACGQGWHILPHSGSMKLIMLSGLTTYIFSYTAYSAAIVTSLSVFLIPIKTWTDLSTWSGYRLYGDVLFQSSEQFANSSKSPSTPSNNMMMNVTEALSRMRRNEPIALISVYDQFYQIAGKANYSHDFLCRSVSKVSVAGHVVKGGMILRQDSPFSKYFNYITIMIQERGLDARLSRHYSNQWSPGCLEQGTRAQRREKYILEINDVFTAFAILLIGFIASGWFVLAERVTFGRKHKGGHNNTAKIFGSFRTTTGKNMFMKTISGFLWIYEVGAKMWKKFKCRMRLHRMMTLTKSFHK